jgi:hypothetical protein
MDADVQAKLNAAGSASADIAAERLARETAPGPDMLARVFPQMSCYDCENCELGAKGGCSALVDSEAMEKVSAAMAHTRVAQESVLQLFA